jgi:hypothetical protein
MNTEAPYRQDTTPKNGAPPPSIELLWGNGERKINAFLVFQSVGIGIGLVFMCSLWSNTLAVVMAFVVCFGLVRYINAGSRNTKIVLRVEDGYLNASVDGKLKHTLNVAEIGEVEQETRAHARVSVQQSVGSPMPSSEVGLAVDVARIVIVHGDERVPLTESFTMSYECTEVFAKVRVFLRKHGWLPLGERAPEV